MYVKIRKGDDTREVKQKHLQNFLDRGWELAEGKKKSAKATVKPVAVEQPEDWDPFGGEDWADSEESMNNNEGEN